MAQFIRKTLEVEPKKVSPRRKTKKKANKRKKGKKGKKYLDNAVATENEELESNSEDYVVHAKILSSPVNQTVCERIFSCFFKKTRANQI